MYEPELGLKILQVLLWLKRLLVVVMKQSKEEGYHAVPGLDIPFGEGEDEETFGRKACRKLLPEANYVGTTENGETHMSITTNGDGACALHALWGVPRTHSSNNKTLWYSCDNARTHLLRYLQDDVLSGRTAEFAAAFHSLISTTWREQVRVASAKYTDRGGDTDREDKMVWEALPQHCRDLLRLFVEAKVYEERQLKK